MGTAKAGHWQKRRDGIHIVGLKVAQAADFGSGKG